MGKLPAISSSNRKGEQFSLKFGPLLKTPKLYSLKLVGGRAKNGPLFRKFSKWPRDQKKRGESLSSTRKGHLWVQWSK